MYIQNNNINLVKTQSTQKPISQDIAPKVQGNHHTYKGEISNVCYRPIFTSNREMSDNEFHKRRQSVKRYLKATLYKNDYYHPNELTNTALSGLNKDNIKFAQKYIGGRNVDYTLIKQLEAFKYITKENLAIVEELLKIENSEFCNIYNGATLKILKNVNNENIELVSQIVKDKSKNIEEQKEIIKALDKENIKFASYILNNDIGKSYTYSELPKLFKLYSTDTIAAFSLLCNSAIQHDLSYPSQVLKNFPEMLNKKDSEFMKKLWGYSKSSSWIFKDDIFKYINSENIKMAKELLPYHNNPSFLSINTIKPKYDYNIVKDTIQNTTSQNEKFIRKLIEYFEQEQLPFDSGKFNFFIQRSKLLNSEACEKLCNLKDFSNLKLTTVMGKVPVMNYFLEQDINKLFEKVENLKQKALAHPELYVNGDEEEVSDINQLRMVEKFFEQYNTELMIASSLFDKEAMDNLMRRRFETAGEYLYTLFNNIFLENKYDLVSKLNNSCNIDGKPFLPHQKVEFIDLIQSYMTNSIPTDKMEKMLANGKVDVSELHLDLLKKIFINLDILGEEEFNATNLERLLQYDLKYIHLLPSGNYDFDELFKFKQLLKLSITGNFKERIQDPSIEYGKLNQAVKNKFLKTGINYKTWLTPPETLNVKVVRKSSTLKDLNEISENTEKLIEVLRTMPTKVFVEKQFGKYIRNNKFEIPEQYKTSKPMLQKFIENSIKQLNTVWQRAEININNPEKEINARRALAIKRKLTDELEKLQNIDKQQIKKNVDMTVKMWDRFPQKDLFQGNYSTCCIRIGEPNGTTMPDYLMNTTYNMIEIVDNNTGNTVGNALCYFVTEKSQNRGKPKPAFVIDNIEINNNLQLNPDTRKEIREAIFQYAKNLTDKVTGNPKTKIYLGDDYNDVPTNDLKTETKNISLLGTIYNHDTEDCYDIYMDVFDGWIDWNEANKKCNLYTVR